MEKRDEKGLTLNEFLEIYKTKNYPRPYLCADTICYDEKLSEVLLIQRKNHPSIDCFAFPGGFSAATETVDETAKRELEEETGLKDIEVEQFFFASKPGRDPRGWVTSEVFKARVNKNECRPIAADDAKGLDWFKYSFDENSFSLTNNKITISYDIVDGKPVSTSEEKLAFDHDEIFLRFLRSL